MYAVVLCVNEHTHVRCRMRKVRQQYTEIAAAQARGRVHRDAVEHRVGAREVDVLEDAGRQLLPRALAADQVAALRNDDHLAWLHVPHELEADRPERAVLAGDAPLRAVGGVAAAEHEGPDAVGVAERDQPYVVHEADARVRALQLLHARGWCVRRRDDAAASAVCKRARRLDRAVRWNAPVQGGHKLSSTTRR